MYDILNNQHDILFSASIIRSSAGESADDSLHPLLNTAPYPLYPSLSTPSNSEPLYSQLLLPYELEYAPYEPPAKGVGGPAAPDDIYVSVIGGQPSFPIADFNSSLPIADPLAAFRDNSELKAIYNQFRPLVAERAEPAAVPTADSAAVATDEEAVVGERQDYGASGYANAFQSVPLSYLRQEVTYSFYRGNSIGIVLLSSHWVQPSLIEVQEVENFIEVQSVSLVGLLCTGNNYCKR
jgi:hypothetical protein